MTSGPAGTGSDFYGNGFYGRVLLDETGEEITDALATYVRSNLMSGTSEIVIDSTVSNFGPNLDFVTASLLLDSPEDEAPGVVRFRVTDADQDLPLDGVNVRNLSAAAPAPAVAFYADDQLDDVSNWGWFVVEVPLIAGENILEFCAEDTAGNVLGTTEEPCVTANVLRESPVAFAVVTEPIGDLIEAQLGEVVAIDGSASVVPPGGVGLWTMGERTSYLGYPWMQRSTMAPTADFGALDTVALMPGEPPLGFRARLVVAASPADLPAELWPEDGSLPCTRAEGEGRCDSIDVRFDLQCNRYPDDAFVVIDEPSSPPTVGVERSAPSGGARHRAEPGAFRFPMVGV